MVYFDDDHSLEIVARGDINIKVDDGIEIKLCVVRHVPYLLNIFLLIKNMDKVGYSTTFHDNQCKITKGALMVALKGESCATLYVYAVIQ